ncbi:MAG: hypothetical protein LC731_04505 [Acidobacteria bacterium]|nr:hypothetical protein [Acidobacteriota bacterium]
MQSSDRIDIPRWYAIRTKPRQEARADSNLRAWGIETFTPKIRETRHNSFTGKPAYIAKPLFPSYIFARLMAGYMLHKICFTRGVQSVISFGGIPCPIEDELLAFIRAREGRDGFVRINEGLRPGDRVTINSGYLKDFAGIFEGEIKEHERVKILLLAISYQARIIIQRDYVSKAS